METRDTQDIAKRHIRPETPKTAQHTHAVGVRLLLARPQYLDSPAVSVLCVSTVLGLAVIRPRAAARIGPPLPRGAASQCALRAPFPPSFPSFPSPSFPLLPPPSPPYNHHPFCSSRHRGCARARESPAQVTTRRPGRLPPLQHTLLSAAHAPLAHANTLLHLICSARGPDTSATPAAAPAALISATTRRALATTAGHPDTVHGVSCCCRRRSGRGTSVERAAQPGPTKARRATIGPGSAERWSGCPEGEHGVTRILGELIGACRVARARSCALAAGGRTRTGRPTVENAETENLAEGRARRLIGCCRWLPRSKSGNQTSSGLSGCLQSEWCGLGKRSTTAAAGPRAPAGPGPICRLPKRGWPPAKKAVDRGKASEPA
jgi:hypothetical protein